MNAPTAKPALTAPQRLRAVLAEPGLIVMPAVYDGLSAKLTANAGFKTAFLSGSCVAAAPAGRSRSRPRCRSARCSIPSRWCMARRPIC